jgi:L-fucose mutarotase
LRAVLSVLPLDSYTEAAAHVMQVVGDAAVIPAAVADFNDIIGARSTVSGLERFAFYDRARTCFAIVQTGDARLYGNIILTKGVIGA